MVALCVAGVACYPVNILQYTGEFLAVTGIMTNTWIFILLSDYFVCRKWLKLAPAQNIEYRDGLVKDWNVCGMVALGSSLLVGALGVAGFYPVYLASFVAMLLGPVIYIPLTVATRGASTVHSSSAPARCATTRTHRSPTACSFAPHRRGWAQPLYPSTFHRNE